MVRKGVVHNSDGAREVKGLGGAGGARVSGLGAVLRWRVGRGAERLGGRCRPEPLSGIGTDTGRDPECGGGALIVMDGGVGRDCRDIAGGCGKGRGILTTLPPCCSCPAAVWLCIAGANG